MSRFTVDEGGHNSLIVLVTKGTLLRGGMSPFQMIVGYRSFRWVISLEKVYIGYRPNCESVNDPFESMGHFHPSSIRGWGGGK